MNLEPCQSFVANYQSTPDSILKDRLCMIENSSYLIMHVTCNKLDNQGLQIIKYIHWVPITLAVWRRKPESNPKEKKKIVEIRKFQRNFGQSGNGHNFQTEG